MKDELLEAYKKIEALERELQQYKDIADFLADSMGFGKNSDVSEPLELLSRLSHGEWYG